MTRSGLAYRDPASAAAGCWHCSRPCRWHGLPPGRGRGHRHAPLAPPARRHVPQPARQPRARRLARPTGAASSSAAWSSARRRRRCRPGTCCRRGRAGRACAAAEGDDSVTWLGHASFLIRLGGRTHPHRPVPDASAPRRFAWFGPQRIAGPGLPPELLPPIDLLLLSHNHYDHLDLRALARLRGAGRTSVVMPLRLSRYLDTGRFAAGDRARLVAAGRGRRGRASPPCRRSISASAACSTATPACGAASTSRRAGRTHPVHRRHRLRAGVRRDGAAAARRRTWRWCRSAPTSRAPLMEGSHCTPEEGVRDRPRLRRQAAVRHALGHHPAHRRAGLRAAGAVPGGGRGRRAMPRPMPGRWRSARRAC